MVVSVRFALRSKQVRYLLKSSWRLPLHTKRKCHQRHNLKDREFANDQTSHIRNIGISAHIDAGKTTTTERMLYYSGKIRAMGEVHHGDTVTDFMEQERSRGITISSASVSFQWKNYRFNLVDTPGHIDFTMEVEQALSVIDGAVIVLDASAGVEAQTQTVWRQADSYNIPRIIYANKMDREDADLFICQSSVRDKLGAEVVTVQLPIFHEGTGFCGVVDLLTLNKFMWHGSDTGGEKFVSTPLKMEKDGKLWEESIRKREDLTDQLSGLDDKLADEVISLESLEEVSAAVLSSALRRVTILQKGVPLLMGSSYKNKGVQPLMDAVIQYLPSPLERTNQLFQNIFHDRMCAQAFKTLHHPHLGPLVFFRIYSGKITKGQKIFNLRLENPENSSKVLLATADDFEEVDHVGKGNIAVLSGLNDTRTGDMITESQSTASKACKALAKSLNISGEAAGKILGVGARPPQPVFFCSIEAPSQSQQVNLERALVRLQREDPSLSVTYNEETSQTILGGMGELHLDIIKERLRSEYKLDILLGQLHIAYREMLRAPVEESLILDHTIGSSKQLVKLKLTVAPLDKNKKKQEIFAFHSEDEDEAAKLRALHPKIVKALQKGIQAGLVFGPKLSCPLMDVFVTIHEVFIGRGTSIPMVSAAASQCVRKALRNADTCLLEPIMNVEVITSEAKLAAVLADLSRRRASVEHIDMRHNSRVVTSSVPLVELLGYATDLRVLTSGTATFSMEFQEYQAMSLQQEAVAIERETGFAPL